MSADPTAAANAAARRVTTLAPLRVDVVLSADRVTVTVGYLDPTEVALVGRLIDDVDLTAVATMALEPP